MRERFLTLPPYRDYGSPADRERYLEKLRRFRIAPSFKVTVRKQNVAVLPRFVVEK